MPIKDKQKRKPTVAIEEAIYQKVKSKAKEKGLSLVDYVNETLLLNAEKDDFLKRYAPFLEKISVGETLILKDHKIGKLVEVYLKQNKMYCTQDEDDDCIHIHFALALPELALLKKSG
ncbi:hypothetical protein [Candidatus Nitrosotalea okcheonensis]|uniref:Uncharacterized protein n=1 Tax=Candidatus Nitrosotalea okcheonensis TaxID=1903276 RepID=A0A2H1FEY1_9ARCH|nr:hypothetical protein [Candidatus Nitrosotalea okcheonensis]SMH71315.1 conserved protein of unknown function [Candidatus Nitrosotalea okcheonensis]